MTDCLELPVLLEHLFGRLPAAEQARVQEHLGACAACQARAREIQALRALATTDLARQAAAMPMGVDATCIGDERLLGYADGSLPAAVRAQVGGHLEHCMHCMARLAEFLAKTVSADHAPPVTLRSRRRLLRQLDGWVSTVADGRSIGQVRHWLAPAAVGAMVVFIIGAGLLVTPAGQALLPLGPAGAPMGDQERQALLLQVEVEKNKREVGWFISEPAAPAMTGALQAYVSDMAFGVTGVRGPADLSDEAKMDVEVLQLLNEALLLRQTGSLPEAQARAEAATRRDRNNPVAWWVLAELQSTNGKMADAAASRARSQALLESP